MDEYANYERFLALHKQDDAFIMPNAWDAMTAVLMREAGFESVGTSSVAIALSLGVTDGTHSVSREQAVENGRLIADVSGLLVNGDLEDGFGASTTDCVDTVNAAIQAGMAGLGIEDTTADPDNPIHDFDAAVARVKAAAQAAAGKIVLTGRTDNYLQGRPDLDDTIRRLTAFAEVGADVLYAPGLPDVDSIRALVQAVAPKPVNVVVGPASGPISLAQLSELGVKRVSLGGVNFRRAMTTVRDDLAALANGDIPAAVAPCVSTGSLYKALTGNSA